MRTYRRVWSAGGTYFFTLVLAERRGNDLLVRHVDALREALRLTKRDWPFAIDGICILPDHLHCIWTLPDGDADFATRWSLVKQRFSRAVPVGESVSTSRRRKGERGVWQRRYWEHLVRDENDYRRHMDYIHYNPVKHGYVQRVSEWPYSSFTRLVQAGVYPVDWGAEPEIAGVVGE
jgi:putative transposase